MLEGKRERVRALASDAASTSCRVWLLRSLRTHATVPDVWYTASILTAAPGTSQALTRATSARAPHDLGTWHCPKSPTYRYDDDGSGCRNVCLSRRRRLHMSTLNSGYVVLSRPTGQPYPQYRQHNQRDPESHRHRSHLSPQGALLVARSA
jgi:hypothetical protein